MELQHFSHEHPLMFIDEVQNEEGREQVVCYGCQKSILGSAYHCGECNYFLHKKCAELPMEIDCPMHYQHPLTLLPHPSYSYMQSKSCDCNVCGKNDWKWFTYNCSLCEFDVDVLCILEKEGYTITHEGHPHPLTLLLKEVSFLCTACDTIGKDVSYLCTKCQFWIHKSCALSPTTITHIDHDHPLVLGYSLPYEYRRFYYYCEICKQKVHPFFWVYYCDKCRYFVHMKCATSEITRDDKGKITADDPSTIIQFPLTAEGLIDLQSELLNEVINLGDKERSPEITYFRHEHPLALFGDQSNSITNNSEVLCDCCIRPLTSAPFYGCSQCSYFLHTSCTELPAKLQHPCHPDHLLYLSSPLSFVERVWCHGCRTYGNGFYYRCESCNYYLDISCALFPEKVKHEGHKHPLHIEWIDTVFVCNPCDGTPKGLRFACDACNFHIEINCVCLPHTFKHDWDRHPLTLSYPPYSDHPDAFYCEICEEEIYPKSWVYRCRSCVQFFHLCCAIPFDEFSKTKFGGTLKVENHPHTITFVRKSENKSPSSCDRCGKDSKAAEPIVECAPCNFVICRECCRSII